jgi:hypothetical protein
MSARDFVLVDNPGFNLVFSRDGHTFVVKQPRWEADGDEDGIWHVVVFDGFTLDDREPTDEESDDYTDDLRAAVREVLSQT